MKKFLIHKASDPKFKRSVMSSRSFVALERLLDEYKEPLIIFTAENYHCDKELPDGADFMVLIYDDYLEQVN